MRGDFSRDSHDPLRHYSRVLQQQGRVELDADGNERQAIQLHLLRCLAADLIGPAGGPGNGFRIGSDGGGVPLRNNLTIAAGHYYVDGWLCENAGLSVYAATAAKAAPGGQVPAPTPAPGNAHAAAAAFAAPGQPDLFDAPALASGTRYLVYIDVWERHVSAAEADGPADRLSPSALGEVALGAVDTASRARVVWQVKASAGSGTLALPPPMQDASGWRKWLDAQWPAWLAQWQPASRGQLSATAQVPGASAVKSPCVVAPEARYRGVENQLYRVEVHRGGALTDKLAPSFVWSRDNGSVVFPIARIAGAEVTLAAGWRDARFALEVGDCVELVNDAVALSGRAGSLYRVAALDADTLAVTLDGTVALDNGDLGLHPVLRRWDHGGRQPGGSGAGSGAGAGAGAGAAASDDGALRIAEGRWLALEDGVAVRFEPNNANVPVHYRSGDYWLVTARTALADVLWPRDAAGAPLPQQPHGVEHRYAPLAVVAMAAADGACSIEFDARRNFKYLTDL